jgi:hypothetical protein
MTARVLLAALLGASLLACANGEGEGTAGPAGACAKCHMTEFQAARHPLHVGEKPTTCGICHTQASWHPSRLEHPWPLTGAHARGHCFYCHHGDEPVFRGTKKECIDCHRPEYEKAPGHDKNPTTCQLCHGTEAWNPPLPDHPEIAREPEPVPEPEAPDASAPAIDAATPVVRKPPRPRPVPTPTAPTSKPDTTTGASRHR